MLGVNILRMGAPLTWVTSSPGSLCLAETRVVLSFAPVTMLQDSAQAIDFKVDRYFGEGQVPE